MGNMAKGPRQLEVGIIVRDLETMTRFYRDGLGLAHVVDMELDFGLLRRFRCGDGIVKLLHLTEAPVTSNPPGGVTARDCRGLRWFTFQPDDIDAVVERCRLMGATVVEPIQVYPENAVRWAILEDPE